MTLLFEFRRNYVRLSPACEVIRYPKLTALYEQVKGINAGIMSLTTLPIEELIRNCDEVESEYGKGYLAEHYNKGYLAEHQGNFGIWEWAREPYIKYRDMWFTILEYVMESLRDYVEHSDLTADERANTTRQIAKCFGRYALAAIGTIPKVEESAQALHQCIALYRDLMDDKAAEDILQEYVDQLELLAGVLPGRIRGVICRNAWLRTIDALSDRASTR